MFMDMRTADTPEIDKIIPLVHIKINAVTKKLILHINVINHYYKVFI